MDERREPAIEHDHLALVRRHAPRIEGTGEAGQSLRIAERHPRPRRTRIGEQRPRVRVAIRAAEDDDEQPVVILRHREDEVLPRLVRRAGLDADHARRAEQFVRVRDRIGAERGGDRRLLRAHDRREDRVGEHEIRQPGEVVRGGDHARLHRGRSG